jgi:tetratricopeptide (TPR) repeat protein
MDDIQSFNGLLARGLHAEAENLLMRIHKEAESRLLECRRLKGNLAASQGNYNEAEEIFRDLLIICPEDHRAANNLGHLLLLKADYKEALVNFKLSLSWGSELASTYIGASQCLIALNQWDDALALIEGSGHRANPDAAIVIGCIYNNWGDYTKAEEYLLKALNLHPSSDCLLELCISYAGQGKYLAALQILDNPTYQNLINQALQLNRLAILHLSEEIALAKEYAVNLIKIHPDCPDLLVALATIEEDLGNQTAMLSLLNQAVHIQSNHERARSLLFELYAATGNFQAAWAYRDNGKNLGLHRLSGEETKEPLGGIPHWNRLQKCKKILILPEEGIGDQLMYASYLNEAPIIADNCSLVLDKRLISILKDSLDKRYTLIDQSELETLLFCEFDAYAYIGDVMAVQLSERSRLGRNRSKRWIHSDPDALQQYQKLITSQKHRRFTVGISWNSTNPVVGKDKSIRLTEFLNIFNGLDVELVNLQYDAELMAPHIAQEAGYSFMDNGNINLKEDLSAMAALVDCCDVIVTISCFTAHLAGSLGKDTILLTSNQRGRLWYWSHKDSSSKSIIYPSIYIIEKERRLASWNHVIVEAQQILRQQLESQHH